MLILKNILIGAVAFALAQAAYAATLVNDVDTAVVMDFTGFTGAGFDASPGAGQLDSDDIIVGGLSDGTLSYGGTGTTGDFARGTSTGGVTTGGIYAMGILGNTALGFQSTDDDMTPGFIDLLYVNNIGRSINNIELKSSLYHYNDQDRSNNLLVQYSLDGINYTTLDSMLSPSTASGSPQWIRGKFVAVGFFETIGDGDSLYIRYTADDVSGSGSRDEFAINDISITFANRSIPEPSTVPLIGLACILAYRARDNFNLHWLLTTTPERKRRCNIKRRKRRNYRMLS